MRGGSPALAAAIAAAAAGPSAPPPPDPHPPAHPHCRGRPRGSKCRVSRPLAKPLGARPRVGTPLQRPRCPLCVPSPRFRPRSTSPRPLRRCAAASTKPNAVPAPLQRHRDETPYTKPPCFWGRFFPTGKTVPQKRQPFFDLRNACTLIASNDRKSATKKQALTTVDTSVYNSRSCKRMERGPRTSGRTVARSFSQTHLDTTPRQCLNADADTPTFVCRTPYAVT